MARGSGILDIGGGRGELAFELLNLNNIRAIIVDPRPGSLSKQAKWLKVILIPLQHASFAAERRCPFP